MGSCIKIVAAAFFVSFAVQASEKFLVSIDSEREVDDILIAWANLPLETHEKTIDATLIEFNKHHEFDEPIVLDNPMGPHSRLNIIDLPARHVLTLGTDDIRALKPGNYRLFLDEYGQMTLGKIEMARKKQDKETKKKP